MQNLYFSVGLRGTRAQAWVLQFRCLMLYPRRVHPIFSSFKICKKGNNFVNTIHCPVTYYYNNTCEICWRNSSCFECFQRDDREHLEIKTFTRTDNTADSQTVCIEIAKTQCTPHFWFNFSLLVQFLVYISIVKNRVGWLHSLCKDISYLPLLWIAFLRLSQPGFSFWSLSLVFLVLERLSFTSSPADHRMYYLSVVAVTGPLQ